MCLALVLLGGRGPRQARPCATGGGAHYLDPAEASAGILVCHTWAETTGSLAHRESTASAAFQTHRRRGCGRLSAQTNSGPK